MRDVGRKTAEADGLRALADFATAPASVKATARAICICECPAHRIQEAKFARST